MSRCYTTGRTSFLSWAVDESQKSAGRVCKARATVTPPDDEDESEQNEFEQQVVRQVKREERTNDRWCRPGIVAGDGEYGPQQKASFGWVAPQKRGQRVDDHVREVPDRERDAPRPAETGVPSTCFVYCEADRTGEQERVGEGSPSREDTDRPRKGLVDEIGKLCPDDEEYRRNSQWSVSVSCPCVERIQEISDCEMPSGPHVRL